MNKKKDKERTIFDYIYPDHTLVSVIPTEEPDFKLKNAEFEFDVEITEFYFSQSESRLKNIPGYFKEIIDEKNISIKMMLYFWMLNSLWLYLVIIGDITLM